VVGYSFRGADDGLVHGGGPLVIVVGQTDAFWPPGRHGELEDAYHIYIGPDDGVYLSVRDAHQVLKYTTEGEALMALGTRYRAALQAPFNHPSDIAVSLTGDIYVSDGYGNSCIHRFTADGRHIASFGTPGNGSGQFRVPHSIRVAKDGSLYVDEGYGLSRARNSARCG